MNKVDMVIFGTDQGLYKELPDNQKMAAVETIYKFDGGQLVDTVKQDDAANISEKVTFINNYTRGLILNKEVDRQDIVSLYLDSVGFQVVEDVVKNNRVCPKLKDGLADVKNVGTIKSLIEASKDDPELEQALISASKENETLKDAMIKESDKNEKLKTALTTAGIIVVGAAAVASGIALVNQLANKPATVIEAEKEDEGFGIYKFDLSNFADMDEYAERVPDSMQKEGAFNRLAILQDFNKEITLYDNTTQMAGLTIEQLVAVDVYSNSNIYTPEDYVKMFGLYDFTGVDNDFQQAVMVTGAYLSDVKVDGTVLAKIFKDETVKANYLKQLEYRDLILNAETSKEKDTAVKEYVEYLGSTATDQTREDYVDYDQHPGMAFATCVVVNALNYNNISLDSEIVSKMIIMGDEEHQSKINSICNDADSKIAATTELINNLNVVLNDNQTIRIYNAGEIERATEEKREPILLQLAYADLDEMLRNTLCDQEQLNDLTNKELGKTNQVVSTEGQARVLANAVELSRKLQDEGKTVDNPVASKLQKPGDTATVVEKDVVIDTDKEKEALAKEAPKEMEKAKEEYNQKNGTLAYETPEDKKKTDEKINEDVKKTQTEGVNYYMQVVDYFTSHGNESGIPSNLQAAYQNLGDATYNLARNTGVSRWTVNNQPTIGGEITGVQLPTTGSVPTVESPANQTLAAPAAPEAVVEEPVVETPTTTTTEAAPVVEAPVAETPTVSAIAPVQESIVEPPSNNGEVQIDEGFTGVEITDISTDPVSAQATYSPVQENAPEEYSIEDVMSSLSSEQLAALFPTESAPVAEQGTTK